MFILTKNKRGTKCYHLLNGEELKKNNIVAGMQINTISQRTHLYIFGESHLSMHTKLKIPHVFWLKNSTYENLL